MAVHPREDIRMSKPKQPNPDACCVRSNCGPELTKRLVALLLATSRIVPALRRRYFVV